MIVFETLRLIVREFVEEDWSAYHTYSLEPAVARAWAEPVTEASARENIRWFVEQQRDPSRNCHNLAVVERATGTLIGDIDVSHMRGECEAEVGVLLAASHRGKGYGAEVCRAAAEWALTSLGMQKVVGYCEPENATSRRMLERAGFGLERIRERSADDPASDKWPRACVYVISGGHRKPMMRVEGEGN